MATDAGTDPDLRPAFFSAGIVGGFLGSVIIAFAALIWAIDGGYVEWPVSVQDNSANQAVVGAEIADSAGCLGCHTIDGTAKTGPTWHGLAGSDRALRSGDTAVATTAYLRTSIVDPRADVVVGFQPTIMPTNYASQLANSEIDALVAYIESLDEAS